LSSNRFKLDTIRELHDRFGTALQELQENDEDSITVNEVSDDEHIDIQEPQDNSLVDHFGMSHCRVPKVVSIPTQNMSTVPFLLLCACCCRFPFTAMSHRYSLDGWPCPLQYSQDGIEGASAAAVVAGGNRDTRAPEGEGCNNLSEDTSVYSKAKTSSSESSSDGEYVVSSCANNDDSQELVSEVFKDQGSCLPRGRLSNWLTRQKFPKFARPFSHCDVFSGK
jgi:hypothetical protein